jgi:hypothetical protein
VAAPVRIVHETWRRQVASVRIRVPRPAFSPGRSVRRAGLGFLALTVPPATAARGGRTRGPPPRLPMVVSAFVVFPQFPRESPPRVQSLGH